MAGGDVRASLRRASRARRCCSCALGRVARRCARSAAPSDALQRRALALLDELRDALRDADERGRPRRARWSPSAETVGDARRRRVAARVETVTSPVVKAMALGTGASQRGAALPERHAGARRRRRRRPAEGGVMFKRAVLARRRVRPRASASSWRTRRRTPARMRASGYAPDRRSSTTRWTRHDVRAAVDEGRAARCATRERRARSEHRRERAGR